MKNQTSSGNNFKSFFDNQFKQSYREQIKAENRALKIIQNINPALGTGQIQIKDIHYVTYQYRTTWEMCQLLDQKYLHSSRRTIDDFYREATRNQWIKS